MTRYAFTCKFCDKNFVTESRYLKHKCREMIRNEEIRTPIGQAAWAYYQGWMKANKRTAHSIEHFLSSRYYTSFINFAKQVKRLNIPDVNIFIRLMKDKKIQPNLWSRDDIYVIYIEYMDHKVSPLEQAQITINTLFFYADKLECDVGDIFTILNSDDVTQLLRQRRISPWLLLFSSKFQNLIRSASPEQQAVMQSIIRPQFWQERFKRKPKYVEMMKRYIKELNL